MLVWGGQQVFGTQDLFFYNLLLFSAKFQLICFSESSYKAFNSKIDLLIKYMCSNAVITWGLIFQPLAA